MKVEKPPYSDIDIEFIKIALSQLHSDYLDSSDEKYLYWDEFKYKDDLPLSTQKDSWHLLKAYRRLNYKHILFGKHVFNYYLSSNQQKELYNLDFKLIGDLKEDPISNLEQEAYFNKSIIQEAIYSSQVEGASTTTDVAKDMLLSGRSPKNESEQMIFNNLRAINFINEHKDEELNYKLIIDLHSIMTSKTEADYCSGDFRESEVFVKNHIDGEVVHTPPNWEEVRPMMRDLCSFINIDDSFIHPIAKASILHFMVGFIHPFLDGNGRTARALFYWYLIKREYTLINSISISKVILESRTKYDKAFLKTENDENDLNYFINYSIKNLKTAFEKLVMYRDKKNKEVQQALVIAKSLYKSGLNTRQAELVGYFCTRPKNSVTLQKYCEFYEIVRQTGSKDLNNLIDLDLIKVIKPIKIARFQLTSKSKVQEYLNKKGNNL